MNVKNGHVTEVDLQTVLYSIYVQHICKLLYKAQYKLYTI